MNKNKFTIIGIILTTVILAGVAIFTALRLYQTRGKAVAPNVPSSRPAAQVATNVCQLSFTIVTQISTPTSTATATATATTTSTATATSTTKATATSTSVATVTPTATSAPQCNYSCTSNSNCPSSMICYIPSGSTAGNCRNTQCLGETDCLCPVATSTATAQPTLPVVGTSWPTLVGTGFGVLVILGSLLLAL